MIRLAVEVGAIARGDERVSLLLLTNLPSDKVDDLGVVDVEADHLRRRVVPPLLVAPAARSNTSRNDISPAGGAAPGQLLLAASNRAEVRARTRAVLEQSCLGLDEVVDGHQVVLDGLDEACGALRALVRHLGLGGVLSVEVPRPIAARAFDAILVPEAEVEPYGRVECAVMVHKEHESSASNASASAFEPK